MFNSTDIKLSNNNDAVVFCQGDDEETVSRKIALVLILESFKWTYPGNNQRYSEFDRKAKLDSIKEEYIDMFVDIYEAI